MRTKTKRENYIITEIYQEKFVNESKLDSN